MKPLTIVPRALVAGAVLAAGLAVASPAVAAKPVPEPFLTTAICNALTGESAATSLPKGTKYVRLFWIYPETTTIAYGNPGTVQSPRLTKPFTANAPINQQVSIQYGPDAATETWTGTVTYPQSVGAAALDAQGNPIGRASISQCTSP